MSKIKHKLKLFWYYTESSYVSFLRIFGFKPNTSVIPHGKYCYVIDVEKNKKEPCSDGSLWISVCKYFRGTNKTGGIACTYLGFYGFDPCLYDSCKVCGVNDCND